MECPNCKLSNPPGSVRCDCGYNFERKSVEPLPALPRGGITGRPAWVWMISGFYVFSVGWTVLSLALVYSGAIQLSAAQRAYYQSLGITDYLSSVGVGVLSLFGAVNLFRLRKRAAPILGVALALNIALWFAHFFRTNVAQAIGGAGLVGALLGLMMLAAIFLYARRLHKRGILT